MKAKIISYSYHSSGPAYVSPGHKKHSKPKNAVGGGNGTYVIAGEPPKVIVRFEREDGTFGEVNMYGVIKYNSSRRVTKKYVDELMSVVVGQLVDTENIQDNILQLMAHYIE